MNAQKHTRTKTLVFCFFIVIVAWVSFWMGTTLAHRTRIECDTAKAQHNIQLLGDLMNSPISREGMLVALSGLKNSEEDMLKQLKEMKQTPLLVDLLKAPAAAPVREHILFYSCTANK